MSVFGSFGGGPVGERSEPRATNCNGYRSEPVNWPGCRQEPRLRTPDASEASVWQRSDVPSTSRGWGFVPWISLWWMWSRDAPCLMPVPVIFPPLAGRSVCRGTQGWTHCMTFEGNFMGTRGGREADALAEGPSTCPPTRASFRRGSPRTWRGSVFCTAALLLRTLAVH